MTLLVIVIPDAYGISMSIQALSTPCCYHAIIVPVIQQSFLVKVDLRWLAQCPVHLSSRSLAVVSPVAWKQWSTDLAFQAEQDSSYVQVLIFDEQLPISYGAAPLVFTFPCPRTCLSGIMIWDLNNLQYIGTLPGHRGFVKCLHASYAKKVLCSGGDSIAVVFHGCHAFIDLHWLTSSNGLSC